MEDDEELVANGSDVSAECAIRGGLIVTLLLMLVCPVRGCSLGLSREARCLVCPRGHSFDVARSGYVNLLQPQDKKSKEPGDTAAAIAGRRRIHDSGVTKPLLEAIVSLASLAADDIVLDAGCGEGFYLGSLRALSGCEAHGVDISIPAVYAAARRYPACAWIVANADRALPYADASFTLVLSITARLNGAEFRRVLRPGGRLLVAIAGADDLRELRGGSAGRDRVERTVEMFGSEGFVLAEQRAVSTVAALDGAAIADLRHAIYRPPIGDAVEIDRVTFALDLLSFRV